MCRIHWKSNENQQKLNQIEASQRQSTKHMEIIQIINEDAHDKQMKFKNGTQWTVIEHQ